MKTPPSLAIRSLAAVAMFFVLWPVLWEPFFVMLLLGEGLPLRDRLDLAWGLFDLKYGEMVTMLLWAGLLLTLLRQSRWALAFSGAIALLALVVLLAFRLSYGGIVAMNGFTAFSLVTIIYFLAPFFVLEGTFRLWRKGDLK